MGRRVVLGVLKVGKVDTLNGDFFMLIMLMVC
jgi:hypothetical protein